MAGWLSAAGRCCLLRRKLLLGHGPFNQCGLCDVGSEDQAVSVSVMDYVHFGPSLSQPLISSCHNTGVIHSPGLIKLSILGIVVISINNYYTIFVNKVWLYYGFF